MSDWQDQSCPLPVIRKRYDDNDVMSLVIEPCGQPLFLDKEESCYLLTVGPAEGCGPTWKVACAVGHVLVVPDHEADDNFAAIPVEWTLIQQALALVTPEPVSSGSRGVESPQP